MERNKLLVSLVLTLTVAACSSTKNDAPRSAKQLQIVQSQLAEANQKLADVRSRYNDGKEQRLSYFAPEPFANAAEFINDAAEDSRQYASTTPSLKQLQSMERNISRANTALDKAFQIKQTAETIMVESFDIQQQLTRLEAGKLYAREYRSLMEDIDDIVEEIADGDLKSAREDNDELLPELRELEVKVVTQIELEGVRATLADLKKRRADRFVPSAYRQAASTIVSARNIIAQDTRNGGAIAEAVAKARFANSRASVLSNEMDRLRDISSKTRESYLVRFESMLLSLSEALLSDDIRDLTFEQQIEKLASTSTNVGQQVNELQQALEQQQQQADALTSDQQAKLDKMDADKAGLWHKIQQQEQQILARSKIQQTLQNKIIELNSVIGDLQNKQQTQDALVSELQQENAELNEELSTLKTTTVEQ